MESDRVTEIVGVVSVQPANTPLWFDIVGKLETSRTVLGNVINCLEPLVKKKKKKKLIIWAKTKDVIVLECKRASKMNNQPVLSFDSVAKLNRKCSLAGFSIVRYLLQS